MSARKAAIARRAADTPEARQARCMAMVCAAICYKGEKADMGAILGLADEFADYIMGSGVLPQEDKLS